MWLINGETWTPIQIFLTQKLIKHCATLSYVKPVIIFGLRLSPVSATYLLCDSGRLLNIEPQFSHLRMRTIIVSASIGCDKSDNYSGREINKARELQENVSFPEELSRISRKGDVWQGSLRVRRNWKLLCLFMGLFWAITTVFSLFLLSTQVSQQQREIVVIKHLLH